MQIILIGAISFGISMINIFYTKRYENALPAFHVSFAMLLFYDVLVAQHNSVEYSSITCVYVCCALMA